MLEVKCNRRREILMPVDVIHRPFYRARSWQNCFCEGPYGELYFSEAATDGFTLSFQQMRINRKVDLEIKRDPVGVELYITLFDGAEWEYSPLAPVRTAKGMLGLRFLKRIPVTAQLYPGNFGFLTIQIPHHFFAELSCRFLNLVEYYERTLRGIPWQFDLKIPFAKRWQLLNSMKLFTGYPADGVCGAIHLRVLAEAFLLESLSAMILNVPIPLNIPSEMLKARTAAELLSTDLRNKLTTKQLARDLHTNDFELKRRFRQLSGTSIFRFREMKRMEQAVEWLINTDMPCEVIAAQLGYKSLVRFGLTFQRHFGFRPANLRADESVEIIPKQS
jgi:AraC-like DNA-binding protein